MNQQVIYTHIYEPNNLPVGVKYENLNNLDNYINDSIDEILITDLLDYHSEDNVGETLMKICNKIKPQGTLHIQSIDLSQLAITIASQSIDISTAKAILYPNKKSIHTLHDIEQLLIGYNFDITNKQYMNIFEYFISATKK
jgi:hypothetical protein